MQIILSIIISIVMAFAPLTSFAPNVDKIPCKDRYQIVIDWGNGKYTEYFICDENAKDEIP